MRTAIALLLVTAPAFAQADRYELGRRVHALELAWDDKTVDAAGKKRASPLVGEAVQNFFKLNLPAAAESLDKARHALASAEPAPADVRWAEAWQVVPETRVVDAVADDVTVTVKPFYKTGLAAPKGAVVRVKLGAGGSVERPLGTETLEIKVPVKVVPGPPSSDFMLSAEIAVEDKVLASKAVRVSRIEKLADRLAAVKKAAAELPSPATTIEQATCVHLVKLLESLVNKTTPETDYPASRLIFGAERLAKVTEPYYSLAKPGEFWLSLPTEKKPTVVRIRVPAKLEGKKDIPVVVALHGMGGSENLYFDAYGDGIVPKLAAERGWIVVAPRVEGVLGAGPAPNVPGILDVLAKHYPIDPNRVYLVGHSMGAGHALQLAQAEPGRYAAVALLGGGGRVSKGNDIKGIRFFVGCGKQDFLLATAKSTYVALDKAGVKTVLKEYDDVEHLLIVREAAGDVFGFFDASLKR